MERVLGYGSVREELSRSGSGPVLSEEGYRRKRQPAVYVPSCADTLVSKRAQGLRIRTSRSPLALESGASDTGGKQKKGWKMLGKVNRT